MTETAQIPTVSELPSEEVMAARAQAFVLVGHRGAMAHRPENSLASYALAEEIGVDQIELDIRSSADGAILVLHDATLDRVAADDSGRGLPPVAELSLERLEQITLDSGASVLTFEQVCEATTTMLQVEIKDATCLPAVAEYLRAHPEQVERMRFTSFQRDALAQAAELIPQVSRGLIVSQHDPEVPLLEVLDELGATAYYPRWNGLTSEGVRLAKESGREVHAWPLRDREDVVRALAWDLDGGTTDDPAQVRSWLTEIADGGR